MKITIDPQKKFEDVKVERIVAAVGIIPMFALTAYEATADAEEVTTARQVFDIMMADYGMGFGDGTEMDVTITPEGTWVSSYEDDPDLYPLTKTEWDGITVYVYEHALVAIVGPDTTLVTRMD